MNWLNTFLRKALTPEQDADLQFMLSILRNSNIPETLVVAYEKEYLLPLALSNNRKYNESKIQQLVKAQQEGYPDIPAKVVSAIYRLGITTRNSLFLEPAKNALKGLALAGNIKAQTTLNFGVEKTVTDPQTHLRLILNKGIKQHHLKPKKTNAMAFHLLALIQSSGFNDENTIRHLERIAHAENSKEGAYVCYALSYIEHPYKATVRETLATMYYTYGNLLAGEMIQKLLRMDQNISIEYLPLFDKLKNLSIWMENKSEEELMMTPVVDEIRKMGVKWIQEKGENYLDQVMSELDDYEKDLLPLLKSCWKEIDLYV